MEPGQEKAEGHHRLAWQLARQVRDNEEIASHPGALGRAASTLNDGQTDDQALAVLATYAWHLRELAAASLDFDDYKALDQRLCEQAAHSHLSQRGGGGS